MVKVIANAPIRHAGRNYKAGDVFEARRKDARLLTLIHRVDMYVEPKPAPQPEPVSATAAPAARRGRRAAAPAEPAEPAEQTVAPVEAPVEAPVAEPVVEAPVEPVAAKVFAELPHVDDADPIAPTSEV